MIVYIFKFLTKVALLGILAIFILSFFGKYLGIVVYHVNFALFYFLGVLLSPTTIRSVEVFIIYGIVYMIFRGAKK